MGSINFVLGEGIYFEEEGSLTLLPPKGAETDIPKHLI